MSNRLNSTPNDLRAFWMRVLPPLAGFGLLVLIWELVAMKSTTGFPSPLATWQQALQQAPTPSWQARWPASRCKRLRRQ